MKVLSLLLFAWTIACGGDPPRSWLDRYDVEDKSVQPLLLPREVSEASGLATTGDGRLLCHDDERGVVYQINPNDGAIVKRFSLGTLGIRGDFEGIAVHREIVYLVSSNGNVYEFREGKDKQRVRYNVYRTFLNSGNDVEGLEYDPDNDCLLLLCKADPGKHHRGHKAAYAFNLKTHMLEEHPRLLIRLKDVEKRAAKPGFNPSGIALHPRGGTFFVISSDGESIIEISRSGEILNQKHLPRKTNSHPEGIAFLPDMTMVLCNDGQGGRGSLTLYRPGH